MSAPVLRDKLKRFVDANWSGAKRIQGLQGGARGLVLSWLAESQRRPLLVIAANSHEAEDLYDDLAFFLGEQRSLPPLSRRLHLLPSWEVLPFESLSPPAENVAARLEALYKII